jgi:superfamily II DNA/RNA helicase
MVNTVDHMFMAINQDSKYEVLKGLLTANAEAKIVLFVERKYDAHDLALRMEGDGFKVDSLHGDMDQRDRFATLRKIKNDDIRILVATDVAARGLNMNQIDLVMNYDVPRDPESYIHRVGRT